MAGQTAHIVVALDSGSGDRQRLYAVGVNSALTEPAHVGELVCLLIEHVDEAFAYDLALAFGIGHSGELAEEFS